MQVKSILSELPKPKNNAEYLQMPIHSWARIGPISMEEVFNLSNQELNTSLIYRKDDNPLEG